MMYWRSEQLDCLDARSFLGFLSLEIANLLQYIRLFCRNGEAES